MHARIRQALIAAALAAAVPLASAQTPPPAGEPTSRHPDPKQSTMPGMHDMQGPMQGPQRKGEHDMPGTVTSVDHKTGLVKLDSLGMHLVVHFPPPTIEDLSTGDKISLHLGYRKLP